MFCPLAFPPFDTGRGAGKIFSAKPDRFFRYPFGELTAFCLWAFCFLKNSTDSAEFHSEERQCFAFAHFLRVETGGGMAVGPFLLDLSNSAKFHSDEQRCRDRVQFMVVEPGGGVR